MASPKKLSKKWTRSGDATQEFLRKRLVDFGSCSTLFGCKTQKRELSKLLTRTVSVGESNSLIIVGPRGCGKSLLLRNALNELQTSEWSENIIEVSLNGLLQTDDRVAIKEITRQLQLENAIGDRVFGSFSENLAFLLEALKSGDEQTKAIFFVLDEFDLFCNHHNQTLLYNLFDVAQSAKTPIAIVGLTCRLDVLELLEKRVKSRFSHRTLYMFADYTFDDYVDLFCAMLSLPQDLSDVSRTFAGAWNDNIKMLSSNASSLDILRRVYEYSKDVQTLKSFLFSAVCKASSSSNDPLLSVQDLERAYEQNVSQNAKTLLLSGMSTLEVCLVLAMRRLTDIYDGEPFNFEMIYREYLKFASHRSSLLFDKTVVAKSFEHLTDLELAWPAERTAVSSTSSGGGGGTRKYYRLVNLMLDSSHIEELLRIKELPTDVTQWASSLVA